jgi:beta-glucosidase
MSFPPGFVWGGSASSYQIEGAAYEDGRGLSVWDVYCQRPNKVWDNQNGDVACDHYHRYAEDVGLFKQMGLQAYRFSVAWPRIFPQGTGTINPAGLAFYDRLVDKLLEADITPYIALFHWDYPYALYCRGGWLNPDSPAWLGDYVSVVVDALSDRVKNWVTMVEPQCFTGFALYDGVHAPGDHWGWKSLLQVIHHVLLAHGTAVRAIRAHAKQPAQIGYVPAAKVRVPATELPEDVAAAEKAMFGFSERTYWSDSWFCDPIFLKQYPADGWELFGSDVPQVGPNDFDLIGEPIDFLGGNIYGGDLVCAGSNGKPHQLIPRDGGPRNSIGWPIIPQALYWGPLFYWKRYHKPIIITENGLANLDWVCQDGQVHDYQRIDYMSRYLKALQRAIQAGVEVRGYFTWSVMDNFEWAEGYEKRFGLIFVDYRTQERTLKDSAHWYREVIETNGAHIGEGIAI